MSVLSDSFAAARESFIEALCARGFALSDDCRTLVGNIDVCGCPVEHSVQVVDGFPVAKPRVLAPKSEHGPSWHQERDGALCLWADEDTWDLPWADADAVLDRASQWHAESAAGWPGDAPDLDLERYWPRDSDKLILYPDLGPLTGKPCKARRKHPDIWEISKGTAPSKKPHVVSAAVVDLGELERPVCSFDQIEELLGGEEAAQIRSGIESGRTRVLMARYQRGGHEAAIGLFADNKDPGRLSAARAAHTGDPTLRLRAGLDAESLSSKSVAIVGVGAVGSLVAEMLARSGVGTLTLIDGDLVMPGNCIRHVAAPRDVGHPKPEAVKSHLVKKGITSEQAITTAFSTLDSAESAELVFGCHDLVIDATGNGPATALIGIASAVLDKPAVTVCLLRGGTVSRVDRFPLGDDEAHAEPLPPGGPKVELREAGCGDPVSPAPPWACAFAAARAAGMAADVLSGRGTCPPTIVDELIGDPESRPDGGPAR